jgi:hypothetical protein
MTTAEIAAIQQTIRQNPQRRIEEIAADHGVDVSVVAGIRAQMTRDHLASKGMIR